MYEYDDDEYDYNDEFKYHDRSAQLLKLSITV